MYFHTSGTYSTGSAPTANAACQPSFGIRKYAASAAASQPNPQKLSSSTINRPRTFGGAYSLTSDTATGSCPPKPKPTQNRKNSSTAKFGDNAHKPVAAP